MEPWHGDAVSFLAGMGAGYAGGHAIGSLHTWKDKEGPGGRLHHWVLSAPLAGAGAITKGPLRYGLWGAALGNLLSDFHDLLRMKGGPFGQHDFFHTSKLYYIPDDWPYQDQIVAVGAIMKDLAITEVEHPAVRAWLAQVLQEYKVDPLDAPRVGAALQHWIHRNIQYVPDPEGREYVQSPSVILERKAGDCDDLVVLWLAGMRSLGHKNVAMKMVSQREDGMFHHVYPALISNGVPVAYELIKPMKPGEEPQGLTASLTLPLDSIPPVPVSLRREWVDGGHPNQNMITAPRDGQQWNPRGFDEHMMGA